jgi:poly-gamma-glutamate synthesis protein (capsule biosynthesis protein)
VHKLIDVLQALVDAGADLIVGAHPHCLQNIEYIDGIPVFYSLGNYFFSAGARDTGVLKITLNCGDASIRSLQFIPMEQYRGVSTLEGSQKESVLAQMRSVSPGVSIDEDGFFTEE